MSNRINLSGLLECFNILMGDDAERIKFISHACAKHPGMVIKFFGKIDADATIRRELERVSEELNSERGLRSEAHREVARLKVELNSLRNPVSNPISDKIKESFDSATQWQNENFSNYPNAQVAVSFDLRDQNKKISTIKWIREQTGRDLIKAKALVEGLENYKCSYSRFVEMRNDYSSKYAPNNGYTCIMSLTPV